MKTRLLGLLLPVLGLLAGCRSEKVTFQFRQDQPLAARVDTTVSVRAHASFVVLPEAYAPVAVARRAKVTMGSFENLTISQNSVAPYNRAGVAATRPSHLTIADRRSATAKNHSLKVSSGNFSPAKPREDSILLNALLLFGGFGAVIGGIILGLSIGGWLGLGVGVIMYLIGALMLARVYGGKWKRE